MMTLINIRRIREKKILKIFDEIESIRTAYASKPKDIESLEELITVLIRYL